MFRAIFKLLLLLVVVAAVAAFFVGYRLGGDGIEAPVSARQPAPSIDTDKARQAGAAIGEKVATGAAEVEHAFGEAALTAKIKSKMALDDTIDASDINVDTVGTVVTLQGTIANRKAHQRVLQLARETAGVTSVVDKLNVREGP